MSDDFTRMGDVLSAARDLLVSPTTNFAWSTWPDLDAALTEIDGLIAQLGCRTRPERLTLDVLFAPTGPLQEVSLSSGWGDEFLVLAEQYDSAARALYR